MTGITTSHTQVKSILTRTSGYLKTVCSHSLQPYRGCSYGNSLCGVGCYVQHNQWLTRGQPWGSFLEARVNAPDIYLQQAVRERNWARKSRGSFSVFLSSSTDPFVPQEEKLGITSAVLEAMCSEPPDTLILQTHSHRVVNHIECLKTLSEVCELRVQISVECDRDRLPGLPPPASSVKLRLDAAKSIRESGIRTVITVSPLFPMEDADRFFSRVAESAHATVIDHFIGGDGSPDGSRTLRTELPAVMEEVEEGSSSLSYRDRIVEIAREHLPTGVSVDGFAGRYLP